MSCNYYHKKKNSVLTPPAAELHCWKTRGFQMRRLTNEYRRSIIHVKSLKKKTHLSLKATQDCRWWLTSTRISILLLYSISRLRVSWHLSSVFLIKSSDILNFMASSMSYVGSNPGAPFHASFVIRRYTLRSGMRPVLLWSELRLRHKQLLVIATIARQTWADALQ